MRDAAEVFAPGEFLREELMARELTEKAVTQELALPSGELEELLSGRRRLDAQLADRLSKLLGTSAELWLRLDRAYWDRGAGVDKDRR